jgi:hypothetical protein
MDLRMYIDNRETIIRMGIKTLQSKSLVYALYVNIFAHAGAT